MRHLAQAPGFEPGQTVLETVVLPLHNTRLWCRREELNLQPRIPPALGLSQVRLPVSPRLHMVPPAGIEPATRRVSAYRSTF